ncbi:hypothetical protein [Plantactinospora sp. BB1]|nr:hypothetical protein [Plantactinospora sp. BB1]
MDSALALAIILLLAALPWRPGAGPAFYVEHGRLGRRLAGPR